MRLAALSNFVNPIRPWAFAYREPSFRTGVGRAELELRLSSPGIGLGVAASPVARILEDLLRHLSSDRVEPVASFRRVERFGSRQFDEAFTQQLDSRPLCLVEPALCRFRWRLCLGWPTDRIESHRVTVQRPAENLRFGWC
jgi:hypothetical protein